MTSPPTVANNLSDCLGALSSGVLAHRMLTATVAWPGRPPRALQRGRPGVPNRRPTAGPQLVTASCLCRPWCLLRPVAPMRLSDGFSQAHRSARVSCSTVPLPDRPSRR